MKQVCVIHGGVTHDSQKQYLSSLQKLELNYERLLYRQNWKNWLGQRLRGWEVLLPSMPNNANAQYDEWALYFSKLLPMLRPDAILIGHSLGGIFLAKYLSENVPKTPFAKLVLVAAPYDEEAHESLGAFKLSSVKKLSKAASEIHLMHSQDDPVVPFSELGQYRKDLPDATAHVFSTRQHFNTPTFPELLKIIKK